MPLQKIQYAIDGCVVEFPYTKLTVMSDWVPSEDGFTAIGTRYTFNVKGVITKPSVAEFQQFIYKMRKVLSRPRGAFSVLWAEDTGIGPAAYNSTWSFEKDDDYGPRPGQLELYEFAGCRSALYSWSIVVMVKECWQNCGVNSNLNAPGKVLGFSRAWTHAVDENGYTTRTCRGTLTVNAADALNGKAGDQWRSLVVPPLPGGYQRVSQDFVQPENGRTLSFTVIDKETQWTLPKPVTTGNANYQVRLRPYGVGADYVLSGSFTATARVDKNTIIQKIGSLLSSKIPAQLDNVIWGARELTENVYDRNTVSFSFAWYSSAQAQDGSNVNLFGKFGGQPEGTDGKNQIIGPYGGDGGSNSGVVAPGPLLYDSCLAGSGGGGSGGGQLGVDPGSPGSSAPPAGGVSVDRPPDAETPDNSKSGVSQDHSDAFYTAYHSRIEWEIQNHLVQIPRKAAGKDPVIQQTAAPTVRVLQVGYAVRDGKLAKYPPPEPPLYPKGSSEARTNLARVQVQNPEPLAVVGQYRMTCHWTYEFLLASTPDSEADLKIRPPADPRVTEKPSTDLELPPGIVDPPI